MRRKFRRIRIARVSASNTSSYSSSDELEKKTFETLRVIREVISDVAESILIGKNSIQASMIDQQDLINETTQLV